MNARENYLTAARGGKPEWVPLFPQEANMFSMPYWRKHLPETGADFLGIKWVRDSVGMMPDPKWHAMEEISQWRETAHFPVLKDLDWEGLAREFEEKRDPEKVTVAQLNTMGLLLIPVNMMGWENALCAVLEEPEEMTAFIRAITDFLLETLEYYGKYIHPDIVSSGDDYAGGGGPFFNRSVFREMYTPFIKEISDGIHSIGALAEFHCCGNCQYIVEEAVESGYDIFQLAMPNEQLLADKKRYGSRLAMTGGWDRQGPGNKENASEEDVRQSVRTAIDTYGKDGGLIFWDGGIIGQGEVIENRKAWVFDEVRKYGREVYL